MHNYQSKKLIIIDPDHQVSSHTQADLRWSLMIPHLMNPSHRHARPPCSAAAATLGARASMSKTSAVHRLLQFRSDPQRYVIASPSFTRRGCKELVDVGLGTRMIALTAGPGGSTLPYIVCEGP